MCVRAVGDSRAVLLHDDGMYTPLSRDHRPDQESERRRVEAAGGKVGYTDTWRVDDMLAVARAFGDFVSPPVFSKGRTRHHTKAPSVFPTSPVTCAYFALLGLTLVALLACL